MKKLIPFVATCMLCAFIMFNFSFLETFDFFRRVIEKLGFKYTTEKVENPTRFATDPVPPPPFPPPPPPGG